MKIFTPSGLKKLSDLKIKVLAIKNDTYEATEKSSYSSTMIENVIEIIDQLTNHNETEYWQNADKQDSLLKLIDKLDNGRGTFVPEVFNKQSYLLAGSLSSTLERVDLKSDINILIGGWLNTQSVLQTMVKYLESKINFYNVLASNKKNDELKASIQDRLSDAFLKFESEINENFKLTSYENFKQYYEKFVNEILKEISELAYVKISNSAAFVDVEKPYQLNSSEVSSSGNRGVIIMIVLRLEENINKLLREKKLPLVMTFHDHYSQKFDPKAYQQIEAKFLAMIKSFQVEKEKYIKGEDIKGFFGKLKGRNPQKVAILNELEKSINTSVVKLTAKNDALLPTGIRAFEIFTAILDAERANEVLCAKKNISLGDISKFLTKFKWDFFNLTYNGIDEVNDSGVGHNLNLYCKFLELDLPLIAIGNEVKPKLEEQDVSNTTTASSSYVPR